MKTDSNAYLPTTFLRPQKLRDLLGIDLTVATETFQHTGSFKFRAAYNLASSVENEHIITSSSGNFGQALAYACKLLNKRCHVVMPDTSAKVKVDAVAGFGATPVLTDVRICGREERVDQLHVEFPAAYRASPYDDKFVIEGNSTLGVEIAEYSVDFDFVVVPIGGGGLISGISKALVNADYCGTLLGAEPHLANDAARSLAKGQLIKNESEPKTVADGARTISLGQLNWEIIAATIEEIIEVSEENIKEGLRTYFTIANLKVEPTGAVSLAALLENPNRFKDKKVCVVVSGGNVDPAVYSLILNG